MFVRRTFPIEQPLRLVPEVRLELAVRDLIVVEQERLILVVEVPAGDRARGDVVEVSPVVAFLVERPRPPLVPVVTDVREAAPVVQFQNYAGRKGDSIVVPGCGRRTRNGRDEEDGRDGEGTERLGYRARQGCALCG